MLEIDSSSLLTYVIIFLIDSTRVVLKFVCKEMDVHSLSCVDVFLNVSAMVSEDLHLLDKCLRVYHGNILNYLNVLVLIWVSYNIVDIITFKLAQKKVPIKIFDNIKFVDIIFLLLMYFHACFCKFFTNFENFHIILFFTSSRIRQYHC